MLTVIDQVANQNHLQLIKAAIPYLPPRNQKTISLLIKLMELQNVANFFHDHTCCISACDIPSGSPEITEILADIRNYCDDSEQAMIDQWGQLFSMLELYSMMAQQPDTMMSGGQPQPTDDSQERI